MEELSHFKLQSILTRNSHFFLHSEIHLPDNLHRHNPRLAVPLPADLGRPIIHYENPSPFTFFQQP
jgi:hypothetical protein